MAKNKNDKNDKEVRNENNEKKDGNKVLTLLIAFLIVVIWLAIFALLIKLDVGGFGSGVLRPILKDIPVVNLVLPDVSDEQLASEKDYAYSSLGDANEKIRELEFQIQEMTQSNTDNSKKTAELEAEVNRLKVFEENQKAFEEEKKNFDKEVVFADAAPDIEEYKKYYESIDPETAAELYQQVIEQLQFDAAIVEKADIYKNMEPESAAKILETMSADIESVAKILLSMKPKESAEILANMDEVFAAKVTKKMLDMDEEKLAK